MKEINEGNNNKKEKIKEGMKVESILGTFEILTMEKPTPDNYGFSDFSFKNILENDPLFKHVISHINEYLSSEELNLDKAKKDIEEFSNFINFDEFSKEIIEKILSNGIPETLPCLRPLIWKSLIGFYPLKDLKNWKNETTKNDSKYKGIRNKYKFYPDNITLEEDKNLIIQINKDLPRTRFDCPFFEEKNKNNDKENNYDVLRRILFYYAHEHSEVSYVQGMNEIIAIIFYIFSKDDNPFNMKYAESDSYFTFEILLEQIKDIFQMEGINYSQLFVTLQINEIKKILKKIDPELLKYFKEIGLEIDNFVLRWILVLFAQEFTIDVAVNFWDRLFTQKNKMKFVCYISVAIIKIHKNEIMKMDSSEVMEWAQALQNKMNEMDVNNIVKIAVDIQKKYNKKEDNNITLK